MEVPEHEMWREFCMQYAKSVAFKFAESWRHYTANVWHTDVPVPPVAQVVQQFTDSLGEHLTERLQAQPNVTTSHNHTEPTSNNNLPSTNVNYRERFGGSRLFNEYGRPASTVSYSWLTRSRSEIAERGSSMLANSLTAQHDQCADANVAQRTSSTRRLSWFRSHFAQKPSVELIKEGNVRYMSGHELDTKQWRKCRLCLVKTAGAYLLQFFSPPKSNRAKSGIFCFLIMEVRETTPLEFVEGNESIFVIRGCNDAEYVIETRSRSECQQWLSMIRSCIPLDVEPNVSQRITRQPSAPPIGSGLIRNSHRFLSTRSLNSSVNITNLPAALHASQMADFIPPGIQTYPWFHARLSRTSSARLVLHNGEDGHGLFLVRQSETRPGEFVLTFNCQGKAKHVRIVVMPDGECRIHQMIFESMIDLLEHFRDNPIPLENSTSPPMLLNEYVICWRQRSLASLELDVRDFLTYAGMLRLDIRALEELVQREQQDRRSRAVTSLMTGFSKNGH